MTDKKRILYDSPEAASVQTVTGWVSSRGMFCGNDEHMARHHGSTHRVCEKNLDHGEHETRGYCEVCAREGRAAQYETLPKRPYDGTFPLTVWDCDEWFYDADHLIGYLVDNDIRPEDAALVACRSVAFRDLNEEDIIDSSGAEDYDLPDDVRKALDAFNAVLEQASSNLFEADKIAVVLPADFLDEARS